MHPILFSLGRLNFYTHGILIALGAIFGGLLIFYLAKREGIYKKFLFDILVYCLFAGIIGARITYIILYYYQFSNWHEMFFIWHGGLVSYGGIVFGFLTAYFLLRKRRQNIFLWFDIGMIGLLLGWAFGRIGCFLTGDVPGISSNARIAISGQIPVSLFEAIWSLILASFLFYLIRWQKEFVGRWGSGFLFFSGLAGYTLGRFIIDFWRAENIFYILKAGQIGSLLIFLGAIVILFFFYLKRVKTVERR